MIDDIDVQVAVAKAMRAEMGRIDGTHSRPWVDAAEDNKKVWLRLARTAISTIDHPDEPIQEIRS